MYDALQTVADAKCIKKSLLLVLEKKPYQIFFFFDRFRTREKNLTLYYLETMDGVPVLIVELLDPTCSSFKESEVWELLNFSWEQRLLQLVFVTTIFVMGSPLVLWKKSSFWLNYQHIVKTVFNIAKTNYWEALATFSALKLFVTYAIIQYVCTRKCKDGRAFSILALYSIMAFLRLRRLLDYIHYYFVSAAKSRRTCSLQYCVLLLP